MNPPDSQSLQIDQHLARLLAAYDQGIGDADAKAPTLGVGRGLRGPGPASRCSARSPAGPSTRGPPTTCCRACPGPRAGRRHRRPAGPPHRVGRFELRRQLGKGGCGIVFLAFDPKLHREVALKIPRPEMLLSPDARRRLIREALAAAEFDHPNLVPVYETGEIGPVCFIATAFCPGQTLAEWLDKQAFPVPVRQAARLVATIAEAVQHAHDRGVLHRDLKPNNVILQPAHVEAETEEPPAGSCPLRGDHFVPRVVDFGLAKLAERGPSETGSRQILGTPKYMAPEQAQARHEDIGPAADVYALGVILYESLAGRAPYEGATDVEVLRLSIEGNLTPPRGLRKDLPRDLEAICLKAMARTQGKRYRTAIDLADDLRRFLDGRPTLARPLKWPGRVARFLRRNDQLVALGVVSFIALFFLGVGGWFAIQTRKLKLKEDSAEQERAARMWAERQREYAYHIRAAFVSWRNGSARQMAASLLAAESTAERVGGGADFTWGYLARLGRVERLSVACPAGPAVALAVSPDGSRLAAVHPDGTVSVWDRATGRPLGSARGHAGEVAHAVFARGGAVLVTASGDERSARCWSLSPAGAPTPGPPCPVLSGAVTGLVGSPDGSVFAGSAGGECVGWEPGADRPPVRWHAADGPVVAVAVSPDGKTVATAAPSGPVRLWSAADAAPAGEVRGAAGSVALGFAPDGADWLLVAAGREDGVLRVFDRTGREVRNPAGHAEPITALAVSPDGRLAASAGPDEGVCVWDLRTGVLRGMFRGHERPPRAVRFAPDGRTLFSASDDGRIKAWDLEGDPEGPMRRNRDSAVVAVAVHPGGRRVAVGYADGSVDVLADRAGGPAGRLPADGRSGVVVLRFPDSGPPVGVELAGRAAVVWEFGDAPRAVLRAEASGGALTAADLSADGSRLAVGDDGGRVTVWSVPGRGPVAGFDTGLRSPVRHLVFSPDGRRVATQTTESVIGVWDVGEPGVRFRVAGHGEGLALLRFLPNGERMVTAGRGGSIKTWYLPAGREEMQLLGHVGRVTGLAVSPDGQTLASGSGTGDVKLWDLRTGQELIELRRHSGPVTVAEFAATGRLMLTGGMTAGGGELAFWEADRD